MGSPSGKKRRRPPLAAPVDLLGKELPLDPERLEGGNPVDKRANNWVADDWITFGRLAGGLAFALSRCPNDPYRRQDHSSRWRLMRPMSWRSPSRRSTNRHACSSSSESPSSFSAPLASNTSGRFSRSSNALMSRSSSSVRS